MKKIIIHKYSCNCGDYYYENHRFTIDNISLLKAKCLDCDAWIDLTTPGIGQMSINSVGYNYNVVRVESIYI